MSRTPSYPPPSRSRSSHSLVSIMASPTRSGTPISQTHGPHPSTAMDLMDLAELTEVTHSNTQTNAQLAERPAGGTTRTPGTKTPRKVQWALAHPNADPAVQGPAEVDGFQGLEATHALDEHGLDPNAFGTLTDALERHRSSPAHTNIALPASSSQSQPQSQSRPQSQQTETQSQRHTKSASVPIISVTDQDLASRNPLAPSRPAPVNFGSGSGSGSSDSNPSGQYQSPSPHPPSTATHPNHPAYPSNPNSNPNANPNMNAGFFNMRDYAARAHPIPHRIDTQTQPQPQSYAQRHTYTERSSPATTAPSTMPPSPAVESHSGHGHGRTAGTGWLRADPNMPHTHGQLPGLGRSELTRKLTGAQPQLHEAERQEGFHVAAPGGLAALRTLGVAERAPVQRQLRVGRVELGPGEVGAVRAAPQERPEPEAENAERVVGAGQGGRVPAQLPARLQLRARAPPPAAALQTPVARRRHAARQAPAGRRAPAQQHLPLVAPLLRGRPQAQQEHGQHGRGREEEGGRGREEGGREEEEEEAASAEREADGA
ncbi:hypothetical protein FIBSPDRAFT_1051871 [Athelia psychrophila]|uniref:Uncharacterized protein n=1 Tax=Athelia psychrophila TaxID=1759441 RepID=A0A165Y9B7_9AGAM|nr:hypothetical protein FIBSPDRAFT_1051871 [Fibularhizoctonia sp. CBS 109695]